MNTPKTEHLTGREGSEFDYDKAVSWTKNHRTKNPGKTVSHFYGKEVLQKLLAQPGCMGIRMYQALDEKGQNHIMLVGSNRDGSDILPAHGRQGQLSGKMPLAETELKMVALAAAASGSGGLLVQVAMPCPGSANCP